MPSTFSALFFGGVVAALAACAGAASAEPRYPWRNGASATSSVLERFSPPDGFVRPTASFGSFAEWLRGLPLKPGRPQVRLYDGRPKKNQEAHEAVIDIDVGTTDLQQCADAVMRLRSEYLFSRGQTQGIVWSYTSGDRIGFAQWARGERPVVGSRISWVKDSSNNRTYPSFRRYMTNIFMYSGSLSLSRDMRKVPFSDLTAGDVFVQGGSPGHAVIVVDVAQGNGRSKAFLLAQSYMPAQEMHVLRNNNSKGSPWYLSAEVAQELDTPEWTFERESLRRFTESVPHG